MSYYYLTRFRADPKKIAVKVRYFACFEKWRVEIVSLTEGSRSVFASHKYPTRALAKALRLADEQGFAGIDIYMCNAYGHPWGEVAYHASRHDVDGRACVTRHVDDGRSVQ